MIEYDSESEADSEESEEVQKKHPKLQLKRQKNNRPNQGLGDDVMGQTKKMPVRTCTGCRQAKNKKDLIRVVRDKEGNVSVDATGKLNGRGAYICPDKECLKKAIKNKGLEKTLKISGIGEEIYSQLEKELGEINE